MADPKAKLILETERRGSEAFAALNADLEALAKKAAFAAGAVAAAMVLITKHSFESIDALAKQSDVLGIAIDKFASLGVAADLAGIDHEELGKILEKTRQTIYDAAQGTKKQVDALAALGLKAEDLIDLSLDEQFKRIAQAMSEITNATERGGLAADIFGVKNTKVLALVQGGAAALEEYAAQAERFGIAINRVDAAKIEQANDAVSLARLRIQGLGNVIAIELSSVVQALAEEFVTIGGNAEEMGVTVHRVIDGIATGVGLVGDAFFGWHLVFDGLRVVSLTVAAEITDELARIGEAAVLTKDALGGIFDKLLTVQTLLNPTQVGIDIVRDLMNGVEQGSQDASALRVIADSLSQSAAEAKATMENLAGGVKPSEALAAALEHARVSAQATAEATARNRATMNAAVAGSGTVNESAEDKNSREAAEKKAEQVRQQLERELDAVRQGTLTREAVEREAIARRQEVLQQSYDAGLIDLERYNELSAQVYVQGQARLTAIEKAGLTEREKFRRLNAREKAAQVASELTQLTAGVAQHNKTLFNLNKVAAIANAILDTYAGVALTLKSYPYPFNIAMAAAHAAAGLAQVQAIRGTSFEGGGGGTTPSAAGSVPTVNGTPLDDGGGTGAGRSSARGGAVINITVQGSLIGAGGTRALAEDLAELIGEHVDDTDAVVISQQSRNGQIIRGG